MTVIRAWMSSPLMRRSRSGVVLAAMRLAMAVIFGFMAAIDPHHPFRTISVAWIVYGAYLLFAGAMLVVAVRSWWFDYRLARIGFAIDAATFLIGLFVTEAVTLDFFSPFVTFFVFLILTSATRWPPRTILIVAVALALCFLAAGMLANWDGLRPDTPRFIRRFIYLITLSLMLSWFAFSRNMYQVPRHVRGAAGSGNPPPEEALDYAVAAYGAARGWIAWIGEGESRPQIYGAQAPLPALSRASIDDAGIDPMLFDTPRRRTLAIDADRRLSAHGDTRPGGLIAVLGIGEGLSIPIRGRSGHGLVVLTGIVGICSDDLLGASGVAREIAAAIDEEETESLQREVAMSRLRSQIATDLHDSVVQTLAGTRFRIEALRRRIPDQHDATAEMDKMVAGLSAEQDHVRAIIDRLRRGEVQPGKRDLHQEVMEITGRLAELWLITVIVDMDRSHLTLPTGIIFNVQQIIREAIANAVRHGKAGTVRIGVALPSPTRLTLSIEDDGSGNDAIEPRSIAERVEALGGTLALRSDAAGTRLDIDLPMAEPA